jgi:CheY-specific phosphatase CheX
MSLTPPHDLTDALVENALKAAVPNVSRRMLHRDAVFIETIYPDSKSDLTFGVVGNVGFSGHANGTLFLCLSNDFARETTAIVLGISVAEVDYQNDEVLKDAICEVTNMIAGGFRNVLSSQGFSCRLMPPGLVRGANLRVTASKDATRHRCRFQCGDHEIVAEIQLQPADPL